MPKLELYYSPFCSYCRKVSDFISDKGIDLEFKNIGESEENKNTLEKIGGKVQVPCLFIDGKPMYESDDIINWLELNAV